MKRSFLFVTLVFVTADAFGQGYVIFNNRNFQSAQAANAPVTLPNGQRVTGSAFTAGLFVEQANSLTLIASTGFREEAQAAGYFATSLMLVEVPGIPAGSPATFRARVWQSSAGSYEAASGGGSYYGEFLTASGTPSIYIPMLGDPNVGQGWVPDMSGIQPLTLIPEPASWSLLAAGGFYFLLRRRSQLGGGRVFG